MFLTFFKKGGYLVLQGERMEEFDEIEKPLEPLQKETEEAAREEWESHKHDAMMEDAS